MTATESVAPLLDASQTSFLCGPVAIVVASHDCALESSIARAFGCRVSGDRREVTVFVSILRSSNLLRDLRAGAPIAVVFTRPQTHETLQLKATAAEVHPLAPGDHEAMQAYGAAFGAEIGALGYTEQFWRAMMAPVNDESVGVCFRPGTLFEQTPGPAAGIQLQPQP